MLTHIDDETIDLDNRVHRIEWAILPLPHLIHHRFRDVRDERWRHFHSVKILNLCLNIAGGHATRIQREDFVLKAIQAGLMLLHQLRRNRSSVDLAGWLSRSRPGFL
jgi:hypothetical protein